MNQIQGFLKERQLEDTRRLGESNLKAEINKLKFMSQYVILGIVYFHSW